MFNMTEHSIMVDLNDERTGRIAEVLANGTCKRILGLLAEKELSAGDISKELKIPLNTAGYNLEKLIEAGLIEKSREWFWSSKGKKIPSYKLTNKRIIISPKSIFKGVIPTLLGVSIIALGIKFFVGSYGYFGSSSMAKVSDNMLAAGTSGASQAVVSSESINMVPRASNGLSSGIYNVMSNAPNSWAWFLLGALTALLIFLVWNWRRK
jgi:DNA-binding transcriptional ArsR family regulator